MTQIREVIIDLNPWWKEPFSIEYYEREIYGQILKFMPLPQIIALTGLRRVGKTTLMQKIVVDAVKQGFSPTNILFFSFDEFRDIDIRTLIREYERILERDFKKGSYLLLLDEVQKLENWENRLKAVYDIYKDKVKIIISGSESLFIRKKTKETLEGRLFDFKVDLLSFKEFLHFKKKDFKPIDLYEKELILLFAEFVSTQGFPELVGIKDKDIIKKYIHDSIIGRIIFKDIPSLYNINDISVLESLFRILYEEPGQMIELTELAKELKLSRQTVSTYLKYLEESFLIRKVYNFSTNRRKLERKLKKYYPAVVSVNLLFKEDTLSKSKVFECLVVNQSKAEFFWRDTYKNEVDMVLRDDDGAPQPVEIKYGKVSFKGLTAFMRKFKVEKGYLISHEIEDEKEINGMRVQVIPAFKFFLR
jgi:predicted AAA+ superfamily ATPase